jgi:DNA repair protein RadA/Sms
LDTRCGLALGANDIYLNVAGGLRIGEPAADLAVAAALVSALTQNPVPAETVVFGEIGLSGEVRAVSQSDARLKEAGKLGFTQALTPPRRGKGAREGMLAVTEIHHLRELVALFAETPTEARRVQAQRR